MDGADRLDEHRRADVFKDESHRTAAQRTVHVLVEVEGGDHETRIGWVTPGPASARGYLDAVQSRHLNVHKTHIGP